MTKILSDGRKTRPEITEPIDGILDALNDLRKRINSHDDFRINNNSMLEKYDYFCYHSERGRSCTYAIQSKQLFMLCDWKHIQEDLLKLLNTIREVPGHETFGR